MIDWIKRRPKIKTGNSKQTIIYDDKYAINKWRNKTQYSFADQSKQTAQKICTGLTSQIVLSLTIQMQ